MVEYWVSHIKKKEGEITQVNAFLNTIEGLKNPNLFNKNEIIKSIEEKNDIWYTCVLKKRNGRKRIWEKGAEIHIIEKDGKKFIRSNPDWKGSDNLEELPSIDDMTEKTFR